MLKEKINKYVLNLYKKLKKKVNLNSHLSENLLNLNNIQLITRNINIDIFSDSDDYNDGIYVSPPSKSNRNSGFTWKTMGSIIGTLVLAGGIVGITIWAVDNINNQQTIVDDTQYDKVDTYYQQSTDQDSLDAMKYILGRSMSVQFLYKNDSTGQYSSISGTTWIFNKEVNSDIYYTATNLHVAAGTTFSGQKFVDGGEIQDFSNTYWISTYIGFVIEENINGNFYHSKYINMLKVPNPEVIYTATLTNDNNLKNGLDLIPYVHTKNGTRSGALDFAILKFDFSKEKLINENRNGSTGNLNNVDLFAKWLESYNNNPTKFYETPITDIQNDKNKFNKWLYMGGFPATGNTYKNSAGAIINNYEGSFSSNFGFGKQYLNFGGVSWEGFSKFPLSIFNRQIDGQQVPLKTDSKILENDYNRFAGYGYLNYHRLISNDPYYQDQGGIVYFNNNELDPISYVNIGYQALIDANSLPGSSGSMMIIKDGNEFKVVGIYWGEISFGDFYGGPFGVANFLNVAGYSIDQTNSKVNSMGYNIFEYGINAIKNNNQNSALVYEPNFE